ncbi:hypothetical protein UFOVP1307_111 [uncultured Caudovirales phage]|uniref:Uncharacterized protein n=1 Tax=uncultured Caudovirales phage TaxID=2100421 RepID=A0A6J5RR07_9CAUD|nr:hypothetical protein UFOVP651_12 [uncultured Caudovirales phage]CAB4170711.1 hypothetical protein UFOVP902_91 [uncultured Caudovirales phage]CAB4198482.1 hypothetical protein UFOVP1307_111 [uncultured Caudovirales phage]
MLIFYFAGIAQLVERRSSKARVVSSSLTACSNGTNRSPISADERNLGSHRIATFTESSNAPRYSVQDPALLCMATGDGEQTISKICRNGFINGVVAQLAERYLCKVKDVGSSPTSSTS